MNSISKETNKVLKVALKARGDAKLGNPQIFFGHKPYACISILLFREKYKEKHPNLFNDAETEENINEYENDN